MRSQGADCESRREACARAGAGDHLGSVDTVAESATGNVSSTSLAATTVEQAAAARLVEETRAATAPYADVRVALAAGYHPEFRGDLTAWHTHVGDRMCHPAQDDGCPQHAMKMLHVFVFAGTRNPFAENMAAAAGGRGAFVAAMRAIVR